jgi:hypothetical protein
LKIIQNLSGKRLDPTAAAAITAIYGRGEIHITRQTVPAPSVPLSTAVPVAANVAATPIPAVSEAPV